jgi:Lrp/AsnC family transcriptional regulator, leucine-responsive regulatory protein
MRVKLDEFDLRILDFVQRNNRLSAEEIAEKAFLSPSAVQRRLRRLRRDGVIEADVAVIAPEAIGRDLIVIVEVVLEREKAHILAEFKELMLNAPEVMQCYYITGDADFVLIMTAKNMQDYEAFARRFFSENPYVRRFRTSIVISRVKSSLTVPLETE